MGYKLKTHRGAAKRFKFTGTGKVKRDKAYGSHLLTHKSAKRMRGLTTQTDCSPAETKMMKKLCPYK